MSIEALWTIEYGQLDINGNSVAWTNGGVIIFETNRVFGGDSSYHYLGKYEIQNQTVTGNMDIEHYHGSLDTAFGIATTSFPITFTGKRQGTIINGTATLNGVGTIPIRLTWRKDLP